VSPGEIRGFAFYKGQFISYISIMNSLILYQMKTVIFHNPRCGKSREALILLKEQNQDVKIVEYLKDIPTEKDIKNLLTILKLKPIQIIRVKEEVFKEFKNKELSDAQCINLMVKYPILIERPIVVKGNKAVIGRPPQLILDIL
jgi:arsenate reductase